MKLNDTIIGSVIIGVLIGGAILISGGKKNERNYEEHITLRPPLGALIERGVKHKKIIFKGEDSSDVILNEERLMEQLKDLKDLAGDMDMNIKIQINKKTKDQKKWYEPK